MAEQTKVIYRGLSFTQLLTIAFIVLKLTKVIAWSWWWVFAPLWIPAAICVVAIVMTFIFMLVGAIISGK